MAPRVSRSRFVAGTASAFASIAVVRSPAKAAQFDYKMAHGTPTNMAVHVRSAEMWDAVKRETNGAIDVKIFPNNILGSELAQLSQLRSGALQFMIIQGVSLSSVVPGVSMDGLGFVFPTAAKAESAYDGPLGAYLRKLIMGKGIFAMPRVFNFGMRQVTSSSHPIRNAADFAGFKIRTPPAPISVDLFKTLGASPTPIVFPELYLALQTKVVDGQETPYSTIDVAKFNEVQKYMSVTNHMATIFWPPSSSAATPNNRAPRRPISCVVRAWCSIPPTPSRCAPNSSRFMAAGRANLGPPRGIYSKKLRANSRRSPVETVSTGGSRCITKSSCG
jgi:TRAP-type transport system periplasmic protein